MASRVVDESAIRDAIGSAVMECPFCVSIADPSEEDFPLIAVSERFEAITGYSRSEVLGRNCRILSHDCCIDITTLMDLRSACHTGASFTAVLTNRKKSGEFFYNLLDLRGLNVARNPKTGEELWFLVGIQADVTSVHVSGVKEEELEQVRCIANGIRTKLRDELSALAVASALKVNLNVASLRPTTDVGAEPEPPDAWCLLPVPIWRCPYDSDACHKSSYPQRSPGHDFEVNFPVKRWWASPQEDPVAAAAGHGRGDEVLPVASFPVSQASFEDGLDQSPRWSMCPTITANSSSPGEMHVARGGTHCFDTVGWEVWLRACATSAGVLVLMFGCYW